MRSAQPARGTSTRRRVPVARRPANQQERKRLSMFKNAAIGLCALAFATLSHAVPITITQTYSDVAYADYGVTTGLAYGKHPTGDWIFTGTVDSDAPDIASPWSLGAYELTSLTLTQASLGLDDAVITNAPVLFFLPDRFGFAATPRATTPWTLVLYEAGHFGQEPGLAQFLALATTPAVHQSYTSFGPQWDGFLFADGRSLFGQGFGSATTNVATVPEPGNLALLLVGLVPLAARSLRRRAR